jgi:hypothetical protein
MLADGPIQVVGEAKIIGPLTVANEAQIIGPIRWQCPTDMDPVGTWCVDKAVKTAANAGPSINACHDEAKTLCPLQAILHCDQKNIENGTTGSCGNRTDSAEAVIRTCTIDTSAGGNVFDRFVEYVVVSASTATSANTVNREFFCCKRVSQ